ncbi:MAG: hypothetical protein HY303_09145, partial [Candidatus Wallbacteria bacterium]|nr:hypothetical protein [Candidatus Wallbacteria bacterium]
MCAQQTGMWLGRALVVFLLLLAAMPYDAAAQGPEPAELLVESVTLFPPGGEREQSNVLARVTLSSRARLRWTERAGVPSPPARDRMAAVANTNEQTIVLFGGRQDGSTPLGDTWIWDGARWTQANTAGKPAGRSEHAMAYAYDRSAVAMFGGRGENGAGLTDTWEFDGIDWNQMQPSTSPSGRWGHGLAADDSRKRVVLFGGRASPDGAPSNDTWEWDGQEWTDVTPATSPPARSGHAMFYDRRRQRVVVAGGEQAGCIGLADVWEWNGTVWTDVTPKTGPSPGSRRGASAAYDYENYGRTLLYGGEELVGCDWTARRDVWAWNGASWTDVTPPSAVAPAARSGQVFTYDFYNDGFLLFGGYDGAHWLQDTWGFEAPTGSVSSTSELTASLVFEGDPAGYRVRPAPENVTLVAGGDSATLSFSVDVTREAAIGPRSLAVTVSARDDDFSIPTLVVNLVKGAFMVNPRPARLAIGTVAAAPTRVSRGQTVNVTVSVENMGDESGDLSAGGLTFNGLESGYSVQRLDANTSLAGLTTATLSYDVTVTEAAPAGPAIVDAWLEQRDQRADNPDEWRVQTRASLSVESVELGADRVHRGDRDVPAQVRVRSEVPSTWRKVNAVERLMRRGNHAMAYDSDRGRTVVFGGSYGPDRLRDTWEFDGSAWLDVTPKDSASPKGRMGASMAYDAVRHRTVLFGGSSAKGALRDTWEWDGSQWLDATPAGPSPSRRSNHTMAFDPSRGRVVLFGGVDDVGSNLGTVGDTWEWDGTTWAQKSPPGGTSPQPRYKHAMAFAGSRGRVVLFGGYNPDLGAYFGDLWEWDGTSWADVSPPTGPSGRIPSAMAWDGGRNRLVLHGCFTVDPQVGGMVPQDTWEWDGSQWLDLSQEKEPSPSGSPDCAAVYDSRRARTVMLGGERPESWEWNGTSWTETTPSKPPEPRSNSSLAFEPASGSTWLFGGYGRDTGALSDTWGWNGSRWARANPASSPTPRWSVASVADTSRHRIVLFGGYNSGEGHLADTWEFDGTNWSNVTPDYSPPARESHAMAYDSRRGRTVLFGGQGD